VNRRKFLAASGVGIGTALAGSLPAAHDDATHTASVTVTDVDWTRVDEEKHDLEVSGASIHVEAGRETMTPVVFLWGRYNWMLQAWPITNDIDEIPFGAEATLQVESPAPETQLLPDEPAQVTVVNEETEERAITQFTPTEVENVQF